MNTTVTHTVSQKKNSQNRFCHNFVKFPLAITIFGRKIVKRYNYVGCIHFPPHLIFVYALPRETEMLQIVA